MLQLWGRPILQAAGRCNREGKVWLNQSQISDLFGTSVPNICYHTANILKEKELDANSVIKDYLITASDGKKYNVICYSLEMILAIGYRVRTIRGVQFRQWATGHLSEYLVKGFTRMTKGLWSDIEDGKFLTPTRDTHKVTPIFVRHLAHRDCRQSGVWRGLFPDGRHR